MDGRRSGPPFCFMWLAAHRHSKLRYVYGINGDNDALCALVGSSMDSDVLLEGSLDLHGNFLKAVVVATVGCGAVDWLGLRRVSLLLL